jgi:CRP-like cAMP-binding protein
LTQTELDGLLARCERVTLGEGRWVLRRGDPAEGLYIVVQGELEAAIGDQRLSIISRGSFFGEISTLLGEPATADVITRTHVECLLIRGEALREVLLDYPAFTVALLHTEARRVKDATPVRA